MVDHEVQRVFDASDQWRVSVSDVWDVLGPFPIHAREQQFLSPAFPLNLSEPINFNAKWPSSYADNGNVGWTTAQGGKNGVLDVSFPGIRETEGWAGLQHHAVLRTSVTLYPPTSLDSWSSKPPHLLVDLAQGSFFTILPRASQDESFNLGHDALRWYSGNIYAMTSSPSQPVRLPVAPSTTSPTTYDVFVSGDYEIRLFGDPLYNGNRDGIPVLSITLSISIEPEPLVDTVVHMASHDVSCDFVDGWSFGNALGVGIRSVSGWWTVKDIVLAVAPADVNVSIVDEIRVAPMQTRIIPIRFSQSVPFYEKELRLALHLVSETASEILQVVLPVNQHKHWADSELSTDGIKATYFFATSMPTAFLVKPPEKENEGTPRPPVLALHGAGVDILSAPFWIQALPRQASSWIIAPTGRTAWGLDWHGPSIQDTWGTVDALYYILVSRDAWHGYALADQTRVLVLGHSNGGQGAWYLASRYPDRVIAAIPAAAYIKSQASAHFIDPALRAILETSFTPDDNDLFLSNLVDTPILAIHGGNDENVPVWHTREAVAIVKTWNPRANITYHEDPHQPHWYPSAFDNDHVRNFMDSVLSQDSSLNLASPKFEAGSFTLTVSMPAESGSLHGWQIHSLLIPGRLARLTVQIRDSAVFVRTTNVQTFSVQHTTLAAERQLVIDDNAVSVKPHQNWPDGVQYFSLDEQNFVPARASQSSGRMAKILSTAAPMVIVVSDMSSEHALLSALQIAHNLDVYHKLDSEIIDSTEAMRRQSADELGSGNIVVLGDLGCSFAAAVLRARQTAFTYSDGLLYLRGRPLLHTSATLFLHPHPSNQEGSMVFIQANDGLGLERALRLFPLRTGTTLPDWIVVGEDTDHIGAAGVEGAGVWNSSWGWNDALSWF
ncbi:uncharacterized protein FIBRA_05980 [Fibroporia radiculosa]|uniref:Peptidase S9 prolyl oligopeptidase catalytic domain-containing protein n=1 Tax=Fibroporia radiculosa TaxID=599839 RepID=J4IB07_9APHY|nr:uncharacterized protein FIBRA_05980 [Fibroporia radiculosa]CCM03831.1 predicted protein [Fibroporia radiculosa]